MLSESEAGTFYDLMRNKKKVAEAIYYYMVKGEGTTEDVCYRVYGDYGFNYVSIIQRGFNFKGQNRGSLSVKRLGGEATLNDVLDFVKQNSRGIQQTTKLGSGVELKQFLKDRIASRQNKQGFSNTNIANQRAYNNNFQNNNYNFTYDKQSNANTSNESPTPSDTETTIVTIVSVIILLLVLAIIFNWFGVRTVLIKFLVGAIDICWLVAIVIFAGALLFNKINALAGKSGLTKIIVWGVTAIGSYFLIGVIGGLLSKLM